MLQKIKLSITSNKLLMIILAVIYTLLNIVSYVSYKFTNNFYILRQRFLILTCVLLLIACIFLLLRFLDTQSGMLMLLVKYRYLWAPILLIGFSCIGIHGYSLDMWEQYIPSSSNASSLIFGTSNPITSDAWAIYIPQMINQFKNGFPIFNHQQMLIGGNMILQDMPAKSILFLGQPHYWGFLVSVNFGIAWLYWFRKIALLLTVFEVFYYITKKNASVSFLGALILVTAPLTNWWFCHNIISVAVYMHWCIACVIMYTTHYESIRYKLSAAFLGAIGMLGFVLSWYPALQVPFGYLALILLVYVLVAFYKSNKFVWKDFVIIGAALVFVLVCIFYFLNLSSESLALVNNTVYPGKRVSTGGKYNYAVFLYYPIQLLFSFVTPSYSNQCEGSMVIPFIPIILILIPLLLILKKVKSPLAITLFIYQIFAISWLFISYPKTFAKITLLSYLFENRVFWIIGYLSVYLGVIYMDYISKNKGFKPAISIIVSFVSVLSIYLMIRPYMKGTAFAALSPTLVSAFIYISLILFFTFYLIFTMGHYKIVATLLVVMCLFFEFSINPIERNTISYYDNNLVGEIQKIAKKDKNSYWLTDTCPFMLANYVYSQGVRTFNATNFYMDYKKWKIVDPDSSDINIYNRYALLNVELVTTDTTISNPVNDQIDLKLNTSTLSDLGIDYIVSTRDLTQLNSAEISFTLSYKDPQSGYSIYSVTYKQ